MIFATAITPEGVVNRFINSRLDVRPDDAIVEDPMGHRVVIPLSLVNTLNHRTVMGVIPDQFHLQYSTDVWGVAYVNGVGWGDIPVGDNPIPAGYLDGKLVMDLGVMSGVNVFKNTKHRSRILSDSMGRVLNNEAPSGMDFPLMVSRPPGMIAYDNGGKIFGGEVTIHPLGYIRHDALSCPLRGSYLQRKGSFLRKSEAVYSITDGRLVPESLLVWEAHNDDADLSPLFITVKNPHRELTLKYY